MPFVRPETVANAIAIAKTASTIQAIGKSNDNHDPQTGEFSSGGGAGTGGDDRLKPSANDSPKVRAMKERLAAHDDRIKEHDAKIAEGKKETASIKQETEKIVAKTSKLEAAHGQHSKANAALKQQVADLSSHLKDLHQKLDATNARIAKLSKFPPET